MMNRHFKVRMLVAVICGMIIGRANTAPVMKISEDSTSQTLTVTDGNTPVLTYQFGDKLPSGVDSSFTRSCYVHPLWSVDGKSIITDDFPKDHFHHHGVFWAWPRVWSDGVQSDNWHPSPVPLRQIFSHFISRSADDKSASFTVENKWLLRNSQEIAREVVSIKAHHSTGTARLVEFAITLSAVGDPLKLAGTLEDNKGYGGFCFRGAPEFKGASILTSSGPADKDIVDKRFDWIDLFGERHGVAIFAANDHPDFPPRWMVRQSYTGFINVSWPGLEPIIIQPGESVKLRYGLLIHDKKLSATEVQNAYRQFTAK